MHELMEFSEEVTLAKEQNKPIVALESTIISHGMPYPKNLTTAREVEEIIRSKGAVPATIAVMGGKIRIGLESDALEMLGKEKDVMKLSRRDMAFALSAGKIGATTVASTMICAELAGIDVFVTGGIGGVHRGGAESFDISADLNELSQTDCAVVCAGAKSILDIPATLEVLETFGVPVVTRLQENFAAFFSRDSGYRGSFRQDDALEIAAMIKAKKKLALKGGVLISNPIPEGDEIPSAQIEKIITQACLKMDEIGVSGKDVTPFLLKEINEQTGGNSLKSNIALVKNNAVFGAELALALNSIRQ